MADILEQEELNALMDNMEDIVSHEPQPAADGDRYDFARQDYAVHRLIPALSIIHSHFADAYKETLRRWVPSVDSVRAERITVVKFGEVKRSLAPPCDALTLQVVPLGGPCYLVTEADLVFTLVDRFFGGNGKVLKARMTPELSPAELRFMDMLGQALVPVFADAWRHTLEVQASISGRCSDLRFIDELSDADTLLSTRFTVAFDNLEASFHLLLPWVAIDPVRDSLGAGARANRQEQDAQWHSRLRAGLMASQLELVATLAEVPISLARVSALRVGDIIPIETPDNVQIAVERLDVMTGTFGVHDGQVAIAVDQLLSVPPVSQR